jgi:pyridoxal phosphate enzyme (YggS family)
MPFLSEVRNRIEANLAAVRKRIDDAARRSGRNPADVVLVAVTKTVGPEEMAVLAGLGVSQFGENRVDAARTKRSALADVSARWHMIGNVQRRKARDVVELFDCVHAVDRVELGEALQRQAAERKRTLDAYVEVNVSGEPSKHGFSGDELASAIERLGALDRLRIRGLMTMAPWFDNPEDARPIFAALRELAGRFGYRELSMGMSNDFEVAVEEGATVVRIGTALFKRG